MEANWVVINILITLVTAIIVILVFVPRVLISLLVRLMILSSKFRFKKYLRLDKKTWPCYLERGSIDECKTSVLFLHGMTGSGVDFVGVLPKFDEKEYHVIALDMLNHGSSPYIDEEVTVGDMVDFMKKFVEKVGLHRRKFHLVSFSMSTAPATLYASKYPDDLASLTIAAAFCRISPTMPQMLTFHNQEEMLNMFDKMSSGKMKHPPPIIIRALIDHKNHRARYFEKVRSGLKKFEFSEELLKKVTVNTFILWGDTDQVCLLEGADYLMENIKNSKVHVIKDCGHIMFFTHATEVSQKLKEWFSSLPEETKVRRTQGLKPSLRW